MNENEIKELNPNPAPSANPMERDYIEEIQKLKKDTVSKAEYERLAGENKKLINALSNSEYLDPKENNKQENIDISNVAASILYGEKNNFEAAKDILKIRKAIKDKDGVDIFVGAWQRDGEITEHDVECAEQFADTLENCIENCDNNPKVFQKMFELALSEPANAMLYKRRR